MQLDRQKMGFAGRPQLLRVVLDPVVGVDDLLGVTEGEPVWGYEHSDAVRLNDARCLSQCAIGVWHVLEGLDRYQRGKLAVTKGQLAHVGDHCVALLACEWSGIDVYPDCLAGSQP